MKEQDNREPYLEHLPLVHTRRSMPISNARASSNNGNGELSLFSNA